MRTFRRGRADIQDGIVWLSGGSYIIKQLKPLNDLAIAAFEVSDQARTVCLISIALIGDQSCTLRWR